MAKTPLGSREMLWPYLERRLLRATQVSKHLLHRRVDLDGFLEQ